ncbi:Glu-tRNA(Gln) amidotransferase subunit GatD [Candidatus Woesearchaeota archaeon]|nr:Glu-tRNA(Gln) amidotransferase subunit GatD [Candidatus Woesearchaeota archaeon]
MKNSKTEPGDMVEIVTDAENYIGVMMPQVHEDTAIIKLKTGYNLGIDKKTIKDVKLLEKHPKETPKTPKEQALSHKKGLKTVSILHMGGTISSAVDYKTGGVIAKFSPEEMLNLFPEIKEIANIRSRFVRQMMSDDMRFAHYNIISKEIEKEVKAGVDGVIITQGTDTMHYTSAALTFILECLPIPVILVGSQRSSDRGSSDAAMNLICACHFIAKTDFADVAICMHKDMEDKKCFILPATKTRKMHTSRRDAFRPMDTQPWAEVDYDTGNVTFINKDHKKKDPSRKLKLRLIDENLKVGILKVHTNMYAREVEAYKGFDGLVIEGTGLGHAPITKSDEFTGENAKIFEAIKELIKKGTVVVMAPQTLYGRLQMNVYSPGRKIQEIGVLGNGSDMTPETTFIKLSWLLSNYKKDEVKDLITKDLRGEISTKVSGDEFLV